MKWSGGLVILALLAGIQTPSHANGGKAKIQELVARLSTNTGSVSFAAQVDPLLFAVGSLKNKYRLIRITIKNDSTEPLRLSAQQDKVALAIANDSVAGVLDLAAADAPLWDGLSQDLRTMLAYPSVVDQGEEESIVIYVPTDLAKEAPTRVRYTIASKGEPIELRAPVAAH